MGVRREVEAGECLQRVSAEIGLFITLGFVEVLKKKERASLIRGKQQVP